MADTADSASDTAAPAAPSTKDTAKTPTQRRLSREDAKCSVEGCKRPYRAKTYCNVHYAAWRRGENEAHKARYKRCTKEACRKPRSGTGSLCEEHKAAAKAEGAPAAS